MYGLFCLSVFLVISVSVCCARCTVKCYEPMYYCHVSFVRIILFEYLPGNSGISSLFVKKCELLRSNVICEGLHIRNILNNLFPGDVCMCFLPEALKIGTRQNN